MTKYLVKTDLNMTITKIIATMPDHLEGDELKLAIKKLIYNNDDNVLIDIAVGVHKAIMANPELVTTALVIEGKLDD